MASIQRIVSPLTKDISYRAQVRVKGLPPKSTMFANRKHVKEWDATLEPAIVDGRYFLSRKAQRTLVAEVEHPEVARAIVHETKNGGPRALPLVCRYCCVA
jgi:hypothetical protein